MSTQRQTTNPNRQIDHLARINLQYERTRNETSIIYLADDFDILYEIVKDPIKFFDEGKEWGHNNKIFSIREPVTIYMKWAGGALSSYHKFRSAFLALPNDSKSESINKLEKYKLYDAEQIDFGLKKAFPYGAILVEFADYTDIISVLYSPPQGAAPQSRFSATITPMTKAIPQLNPNVPIEINDYGHLHFDIGQDHVQRAIFAVDYIKDRSGLLNSLTPNQVNNFKYFETTFSLTLRGNTAPLGLPNGKPSFTFFATKDWYPSVIVENIRANPGTNPTGLVCVDVSVGVDNYLHDVIIKKY